MSSGLPGLDRVLQGLMPGDNVVWEVDAIADYLPTLTPLVQEAKKLNRKLIYFRFARHAPLLTESSGVEICVVDPQEGFERFLTRILNVIESAGPGAFYIFDCLSDLAADWFSDRMLGNFFMIACPYLYELDTLAYFALLKEQHSLTATQSIARTAQVMIEVFRKDDHLFIHPLKVWKRSSPSMYSLHSWQGEEFRPVTNSAVIADLLASVPKPWLEFTIYRPGIWLQTFQQAQQAVQNLREGRSPDAQTEELFHRLVRMVATRDDRFVALVEKHFSLADLVAIMQRMIGTGLIGGKSLGMLLARTILQKTDPLWTERLESHDSFYVGSDVFYTYLVENGGWWLRRRQKDFSACLERASEARKKMLHGVFSESIQDQFMEMLEYFGQAPLIVRSSSLLEDNYGNSFSGKYESVFLANQGAPQERLEAFMNAVRTVYASSLSEEALRYRLDHGLLERDEQMALLIQRVSGDLYGPAFFPHVAGVGFSFNPFVWSREIDPHAGMLRLVFGLGTRAVDRTDDDYTRLVALNAPSLRPDMGPEGDREFTQRKVDLLDLSANQFGSRDFEDVARELPKDVRKLFLAPNDDDSELPPSAEDRPAPLDLCFDHILTGTEFVPVMRDLCRILGEAYSHAVDIEFTANFTPDGRFRVNLVQCRPFQVRIRGEASRVQLPERLDPHRLLLQSAGPIVGHSVATAVDWLVYVVPSVYATLTTSQKYSVARSLGRLFQTDAFAERPVILLAGPGRWCTSMPWLGVPASFPEISKVSIVCEIAAMHDGLVPEVSLGTHFFNDLVERDMLYLAVTPGKTGHVLNEDLVLKQPNQLTQLLPSAGDLEPALRVLRTNPVAAGGTLLLHVDSMQQKAVCF